jgi:type II secretory pathway pseudopilin PulG
MRRGVPEGNRSFVDQTWIGLRSRAARTGTRREAFTLLEVVISVGLISLLMAGLYSAMNLCFTLQTDSHDDVERLQIARIVLRQFTRDIQSVVFVNDTEENSELSAGAGSETSSAESSDETTSSETALDTQSTLRTSGLVGSETELMLFVSRPDRGLSYVPATEIVSAADRSSDVMVVRYLMAQEGAGGLGSAVAERESSSKAGPAGLIRLEGDAQTVAQAMQENEDEKQLDAAKLWAAEVTDIRFQYFDGINWQSGWDSLKSRSVPNAIEVVITLRTLPPENEDSSKSDQEDQFALPESTHRMVVSLPISSPATPETAL